MNNLYTPNYPEAAFSETSPDSDLRQQLGFIPGLKELLMLRQVHALEHGTIWELTKGKDDQSLGGLSTDQGFYLYGKVAEDRVERAVIKALRRFKAGEIDLAIHPRCGTNFSVGMLIGTSLALGSQMLLPKDIFSQLLGLGIATTVAVELAPEVGSYAQKYLTTAVPLNLQLLDISTTSDWLGRKSLFVQLAWQN